MTAKSYGVILLAISLMDGCSVGSRPGDGTFHYDAVYALSFDDFVFEDNHYDAKSIVQKLSKNVSGTHVVVLRGGKDGLKLGELLEIEPILNDGRTCLFLQEPNGAIRTVTFAQKEDPSVDQSFCPKRDQISSHLVAYVIPDG